MAATKLEFDPVAHTYTVDGERVPGVTELLHKAGLIDVTWYTDHGRTRGDYVARATHYYDQQDLNLKELDPEIKPYVDGWRAFRHASNIEILASEETVLNHIWRYAGTLDRRVKWDGRETIIDIKLGQPQPWHAIQLAMYAACFPTIMQRVNVYLRPRNFKVVTHTNKHDYAVAQAITVLHCWKRMNGVETNG